MVLCDDSDRASLHPRDEKGTASSSQACPQPPRGVWPAGAVHMPASPSKPLMGMNAQLTCGEPSAHVRPRGDHLCSRGAIHAGERTTVSWTATPFISATSGPIRVPSALALRNDVNGRDWPGYAFYAARLGGSRQVRRPMRLPSSTPPMQVSRQPMLPGGCVSHPCGAMRDLCSPCGTARRPFSRLEFRQFW